MLYVSSVNIGIRKSLIHGHDKLSRCTSGQAMARLWPAQDLSASWAEGESVGDVVVALFWNWQLLNSDSSRPASSTPHEVKHAAGQATMRKHCKVGGTNKI